MSRLTLLYLTSTKNSPYRLNLRIKKKKKRTQKANRAFWNAHSHRHWISKWTDKNINSAWRKSKLVITFPCASPKIELRMLCVLEAKPLWTQNKALVILVSITLFIKQGINFTVDHFDIYCTQNEQSCTCWN